MAEQATMPAVETAAEPALKLNFLSHGTLESKNLERAREFYTEFLGLQVVRTSPISLLIRLGGPNTIAVVEQKNRTEEMPMLNHNGLDVETQGEVDAAHETVVAEKRKSGACTGSRNPSCSTAPTASSSGTWTTIAGRS